MERKIKIWLLIAVIFALLIFIFSNSMKNREDSKSDSDFIVRIVEPFVEKLLGYVPENLGFIIRKLAHLTEFGTLGFFVCLLVHVQRWVEKKCLYGYAAFGLLFAAVTDEFIQIFSGRGSSVSDVLIDFCGAVIGSLICFAAVALSLRKNTKKEKE